MRSKGVDVGERFGRLTIVELVSGTETNHSKARVLCDCGTQKIVQRYHLRAGKTKSCGCLRSEVSRRKSVTHGRRGSTAYLSWQAMKNRCLRPTSKDFQNYGGRGITVCDRWLNSFENFLADMGERPAGKTLDRIHNDGNYEPGNCRWATRREQNLNQRRFKAVHANTHPRA